MIERLVIGAGPVGLVAGYLLGARVVGLRKGAGRVAVLAPLYLWRTEKTVRLLKRLEVPFVEREAKFGFLDAEAVYEKCDLVHRLVYYRRSRGLAHDEPVNVPPSVMSSGMQSRIPTFDVTVAELADACAKRVEITDDNVVSITVHPTAGSVVYYGGKGAGGWSASRTPSSVQELINTLPAPTFDRLARRVPKERFLAGPKTFVVGKPHLDSIRSLSRNGYEYAYVVDPVPNRIPYDRVKVLPDGLISYEFNKEVKDISQGFIAEVEGDIKFTGPVQVLGERRDEFEPGVRHVGRMARWDHRFRIHDIVQDLM